MRGIVYCRVSSKEQVEGTSLEFQEAACREYARAKNIAVIRVFVEQGESAKFADRTQLLELLSFVRQNKAALDVLLVWKVDRFARNVADHFSIKAQLLKYGVRVVSVTEPIDANPEGQLMETILAGFAQFDNDIRASRTVHGMRRKLQEGIYPWKTIFGYKTQRVGREKKTLPDVPDQPIFGLLQKAWNKFLTGAYTRAQLARLLNSWDVRTRAGKKIDDQFVDDMLRNRFYSGVLTDPWSGEEYEGKHVPLVSRADFARTQQFITRTRRAVSRRKYRSDFPLRGLVRCDTCTHLFTANFSRGSTKKYRYYLCRNADCPRYGKSLRGDLVEEEFATFLQTVAIAPETIDRLRLDLQGIVEERRAARKENTLRLRKDLAAAESELRQLIAMRAQELIGNEDFITHRDAVIERRTSLEASIRDAIPSAAEVEKQLQEICSPLNDLSVTWGSLPALQRRGFEQILLPVGYLIGNIRTAETGLLFRLSRPLASVKSSYVTLSDKSSNQIIQEIQAIWKVLFDPEELKEPPKRCVRKKRRR